MGLRPTLLLLTQELRLLVQDRQALGLLFLMPLAFIVFLTLALQNVYLAKIGTDETVTVIVLATDCNKSGLCADLISELKTHRYQVEMANALPDERKIHMALILPKDIEKSVKALQAHKALADEEKFQLQFDPTLDASLRSLLASNVTLSLQAVLLKRLPKNMPVPNVSQFDGLLSEKAARGFVLPNPIQQTVPAWALFGMFFICTPLAGSLIRDRRNGIYKRLLSFPVSSWDLLIGKILPFWLINILQFALMFAVGFFVLPHFIHLTLELKLQYGQLLVVTLVCACAATSYGAMIACLARTAEQALAFGSLSIVILAILGGVMIPHFVMPDFMQDLAKVSPLYWGLESYHDIMLRHASWSALAPKLYVLLGFSFLCVVVSTLRFRWHEAS